MANAPEPILDLSEIVNLYKDDARRMVGQMREGLTHWDEVRSGGNARQSLRRLAHQLRGSGSTYGFHAVTRVCKALENIVIKLEKNQLQADERVRQSMAEKIDRVAAIFSA